MKATHRLMLLALVLSLMGAGVGRRSGTRAEEAEVTEAVLEADPVSNVAMVEVVLDKETVRGRILHETDDQIRIESFGKGVIGYRKAGLHEVRRFTLRAAVYYQELGDFHRRRAWEAEDGAVEFIKARQAYMRVMSHALTEAESARVTDKLGLLSQERDEWQKEVLRREEIKQAQEQTELVKLQRQAAAEQLAAARRHEQYIQELQRVVRDLQDQTQRMGDFLRVMDDTIQDLEDDVDRLERRDRVYITTQVFLDLKRSHETLQRKVQRLERSVERE